MAEIINLNRARKARAKAESKAAAEASRARHGRTRADRTGQDAARNRADRHLDGHKREDDDE
ncbi:MULTISPECIES: DUF4169 family protein [Brevundimonas]|jgi:hypothetical protein|uniref:DUF4169 family protein n=1 Tax=Brevundimonas halotolerans TaxID=69670 RepID=A0A7W9A154_9CAUL|nr:MULTISPECIES: DUF4169 family protein [Brevundimonas]MAL89821.1 hypothetical protein [Brevundimonas sp.]MBB5659508.1 hypothetical protein [Brevundimonas halotolerans]HAV48948.1 DUF4169 domain-containing protein [Brevundimonas sp.]|tara:strand:- start:51342 stop:51527 length:186 start_codon:yes stop_codon:yes gene_type:complete